MTAHLHVGANGAVRALSTVLLLLAVATAADCTGSRQLLQDKSTAVGNGSSATQTEVVVDGDEAASRVGSKQATTRHGTLAAGDAPLDVVVASLKTGLKTAATNVINATARSTFKSTQPFSNITSVRGGGWPSTHTLVIRPSRGSEPTYGVATQSINSIVQPGQLLLVRSASALGVDQVVLPAKATNPRWTEVRLAGVNYVNLGLANNVDTSGNCLSRFELSPGQTLTLTQRGTNGILMGCFTAPAGSVLRYVTDGAASVTQGSHVSVDTLHVQSSRGTNRLIFLPGSMTVNTIQIGVPQGELYVQPHANSADTTLQWNNVVGGELWIKARLSKCPFHRANSTPWDGYWNYNGANIGNSKYCCGPGVVYYKDGTTTTKSCPAGSVRAGRW